MLSPPAFLAFSEGLGDLGEEKSQEFKPLEKQDKQP